MAADLDTILIFIFFVWTFSIASCLFRSSTSILFNYLRVVTNRLVRNVLAHLGPKVDFEGESMFLSNRRGSWAPHSGRCVSIVLANFVWLQTKNTRSKSTFPPKCHITLMLNLRPSRMQAYECTHGSS
jgi:hypothetical protein